jgi:hypothetical protein
MAIDDVQPNAVTGVRSRHSHGEHLARCQQRMVVKCLLCTAQGSNAAQPHCHRHSLSACSLCRVGRYPFCYNPMPQATVDARHLGLQSTGRIMATLFVRRFADDTSDIGSIALTPAGTCGASPLHAHVRSQPAGWRSDAHRRVR